MCRSTFGLSSIFGAMVPVATSNPFTYNRVWFSPRRTTAATCCHWFTRITPGRDCTVPLGWFSGLAVSMRNTPWLFGMSRYQPCVQLYLPRQTMPPCRSSLGRIHADTVKSPTPTFIEGSRGTTTASSRPSNSTACPSGPSTNFAPPTSLPDKILGRRKLSAFPSSSHAPTSC